MLFSEEFIHAFGWTILHSLWQATLVAAILVLFLRKLKSASALSRYWAAVAALGAVFIVAIFTFTQVYENQERQFSVEESSTRIYFHGTDHYSFVIESPTSETTYFSSPVAQWTTFLENQLPIISLLWVVGVLFFSMRFGFGLLEIERLQKTKNFALDLEWEERLKNLARQLGLFEKVQLRESLLTNVPIVLGHFKPLILLPIGTINALSIEQVEAILAHELAHIARKDYLVNILQSIVEIFFFFNPVIWWISAQIRMERENCCDDQAMSTCDDNLTYAKALLQLKEIQYRTPALSLSFFGSKNQLLQRVQRILNHPNQQSRIMEKFAVTCLLLITLLFFGIQQNKAAESNLETPEITEDIVEEPFSISVDTLPNAPEGMTRITLNEEGRTIETQVENGVIQSLSVNGKRIPESEFEEYEAMVQKLIDDIPAPPSPPVAPPSPPSPPSSFAVPPAPPSPPFPPSPPTSDEEWSEEERSIHLEMETLHKKIEEKHKTLEKEQEMMQKALEEAQRKMERDMRRIEKMEGEEREKALKEAERDLKEQKELQEEALGKARRVFRDDQRDLREQERELRTKARRLRDEGRKMRVEERTERSEKRADFMKNLGQNLLEDGLIEEVKDYQFELDDEQLKVNGKVQSNETYEKYKKLIEQHKSVKLSSKDRVKIEVSENSQSIHFDFSLGGGKYNNEGPMPKRMLEQLYATEAQEYQHGTRANTRSLYKRKLFQKIGQSLVSDQVIDKNKNYSFILNARMKKLVINGQHYPALQAKYEQIVRKAADFEMSHDFIYEFEYRDQMQTPVELSNCFPNKDRTYGPLADAYQTYLFDNFAFGRELSKTLKEDDLIGQQQTFKLKINDNELLINGKKQPKQLQEKYESLFRMASNTELTSSFQLAVEKYNGNNTNFIIKAI